jgi:hypothetical protein
MAGVADCAEARALWHDTTAPVQRRCLAARALGLLGEHGPKWSVEGVEDDESPLGRARWHGSNDFERRRRAEYRFLQKEEALDKMRQLGVGSVAEVIRILQDQSANSESREAAASVLRGLRYRGAVEALIEVLGEGHQPLSFACMEALKAIGSRGHARRLIAIVRGDHPLPARQEAIYTLWQLHETRAESLFIRIGAAVDTEEEYTRDMATEALGNTADRSSTQRAIAERLFDPSISVRYAALCACPTKHLLPLLRRALVAKLDDPGKVDDNRVIAETAAELLDPRRYVS